MKIRIAIIALGAVAAMASCSKTPEFLGQWVSSAPVSLKGEIPAASQATAQLTFDFSTGTERKSGPVMLTSDIDLTQPVSGDSSFVSPYEVSVAATASVNGTWTYASDDDDELVLSFDMSTLNVVVDPHGVTFSQNLLTGTQQPVLDSLTTVTAERWKAQVKGAVTQQLSRFSMVDDVEVSDNRNVLTFEVRGDDGHDVKCAFRRVLVGE